MARQVSGLRYAQALFELASQQGRAEAWSIQLAQMAEAMRDAEFNALLKHAEFPLDRKVSAIATVLPEVDPLVRNLGALLISRGSVDTVGDVSISYNRLLDQLLGRQQVEATTAVALEAADLEAIRRFAGRLVEKEVVVTTQVDESILGGIIIRIGDRLLDGSVRSKLEALRKRLRSEAI